MIHDEGDICIIFPDGNIVRAQSVAAVLKKDGDEFGSLLWGEYNLEELALSARLIADLFEMAIDDIRKSNPKQKKQPEKPKSLLDIVYGEQFKEALKKDEYDMRYWKADKLEEDDEKPENFLDWLWGNSTDEKGGNSNDNS